MRTLRVWINRLANVLLRRNRDKDFADEIQSNLQLHIEDNIRRGMTPAQARRAALVKFGSIDAAKEGMRDERGIAFLETLLQDVSHTFRLLRLNKVWATVAILTLVLGLGVNIALFGVVNGVFFQELPVPNAERLVSFRAAGDNTVRDEARNYGYVAPGIQNAEREDASFSFITFNALQKQSGELADVFAFAPFAVSLNAVAQGQADLISGQSVSGNYYSALRVSAFRGRTLTSSDDSSTAPPAAVISYGYWKRRFELAPEIIGRSISINSIAFTVVGITPPAFGSLTRTGEEAPDITIPLSFEPSVVPTRSLMNRPANLWLLVMARLMPGIGREQLQARLESVFDQTVRDEWTAAASTMSAERRTQISERGMRVPRLRILSASQGVYDVRPQQSNTMLLIGAIVVLVLFIVCLNLANLQLSRAVARRKELLLRTAIGATPFRLVRQLFTESMVLALFGGAGGLSAAYWLRTFLPVWFGFKPISIDWNVLGFSLAVSGVAGLVFGLVPALRGGTIVRFDRRSRTSQVLLIAQVAMSVVLLLGAGLFLQTLRNLQTQDIGFNPDRMAIFSLSPPANRYNAAAAASLYDQVLERLKSVPGVESATLSDPAVLSGSARRNAVSIEEQSRTVERHVLTVHYSYFDTIGIPMRAGREFTAEDNAANPRVTIVNEAFAKEFFPNTNPLGKHLRWQSNLLEIVGIAGNAKYASLRDAAPSTFYIPHLQRPAGTRWFTVRTTGAASTIIPAIRDVVGSLDPALPLQSLATQTETMDRYLGRERMFALTLTFFAALALIIAGVGIFGLTSYTVARRTREIGIRMAIGAQRSQVVRSMLRETLGLVLFGAVIGTGASLLLKPFVQQLLFGLAPDDPKTVVAVVTLMIALALAATYFPARRASHIDPMIALREE